MKKLVIWILVLALCAGLAAGAFASGEASEAEAAGEPAAPAEDTAEEAPETAEEPAGEPPAEDAPVEAAEEAAEEEAVEEEPADTPAEDGAGSVPVDEAHFPDRYFRSYVSNVIDTDRSGTLDEAEIAAVKEIQIGGNNPTPYDDVQSFAGIAYFPALETFHLRYIGKEFIGESRRIDIDLSGNPALTTLILYVTMPQTLDLTHNPALKSLQLNQAGLTALDLSGCPALETLDCYNNSLTALDLTHNPALTELYCGMNELSALDVSVCPGLTRLECRRNSLTALDVSAIPGLTYLECTGNPLKTLDVRGCPALETLYCSDAQLTVLDLSHNTVLADIRCSGNPLEELYLGGNTVLPSLSCSDGRLTTLDVSGCTALEELSCSNNRLTELSLTNNPALKSLDCTGNAISSLDVSGCPVLERLYCYGNPITSLDLDGTHLVTALEKLSLERGKGYQWYKGFVAGVRYALVTDAAVTILPEVEKNAAAVGSVIRFGVYEQDNDLENGPEPIEWIVLDKDGDRLLVISKYLLEKRALNDEAVPVTELNWTNCSLRTWLNGTFLDAAFTKEQQAAIQLTALDTPAEIAGFWWGERPISYPSEDQIFLLSSEEAKLYFPDDYHRVGRLTAYANAQEGFAAQRNVMLVEYDDPAYIADEFPDKPFLAMDRILQQSDCLDWFLRNMDGRERTDAAWVRYDGKDWWDCGCMMTYRIGVRPAMWVAYDSSMTPEEPKNPYDADENGLIELVDAPLLLKTDAALAGPVLRYVTGLGGLPEA